MAKFPKYKLTEKQIRGIANIVMHEQGTLTGWYAEASQIANRTDIRGDKYATAENAVKTVTSGWYAHGRERYNIGTSNRTACKVVRDVLCKGKRTLPRYIDEHDCFSDIGSAKNGHKNVKKSKANWIAHKTRVHNHMGSSYTFYEFPGGASSGNDPFGYTSKAYRKHWGNFCYSVAQARNDDYDGEPAKFDGPWPELPKRGFFHKGDSGPEVKKIQHAVNFALNSFMAEDGEYGSDTDNHVEEWQKRNDLPKNGKWGRLCEGALKKEKF